MAPASGAVDEAVAFLQKSSSTAGSSVFDHLTSVVHRILEERPANAVDILETSLLVKKTAPPPIKEQVTKKRGPDAAALAAVAATLRLYSTPEPDINPETGEAEEAAPLNEYEGEDVVLDAALYEAVGVGLGRRESYRVALALHKLGQDPTKNIATVRFFGKLFGTTANYYVFESVLRGEEEEEALEEAVAAEAASMWGRPLGGAPKEERSGTNAAVYWVTQQLGGDFTRLPDVTPLQIQTARSIKKFLTGDLKAEVSAYPPFPGVEAHFLRAQLARIGGTTTVCPAGYFSAGEDEGSLQKSEEYSQQPAAELAAVEAWVHKNAHIKKQGRCSVYVAPPPEESEEGEEEERQPTEEEAEESPAPLTSLENDAELPTGGRAWAVTLSSDIPGLKYKVACIRSLLWPGAHAIATPSGFSNIYIGWGVKNAPLAPPSPPEVQKEYEPGEGEPALAESNELPPKPEPEVPENQDGEGEEDEGEGEEDEEGEEEEEEEEEEDE